MPLQCTSLRRRWQISSVLFMRTLKRPEGRAPVESSVRSEIFVATRATPFPSPVGAASSGHFGTAF